MQLYNLHTQFHRPCLVKFQTNGFEIKLTLICKTKHEYHSFQASAIAKKPEVRKTIAQRPAAANGVKTGRVKKNFNKNKNATNSRNVGNNAGNKNQQIQVWANDRNAPNNKGNSGGGGQNWQNMGKAAKRNMNIIMNY